MNPIQEAKQGLEASIRYAENAIEHAKITIEQVSTYQEQTGREEALTKQVQELEEQVKFYKEAYTELEVANGKGVPTMPVIPKAVAIAIFREGVQHGVEAACTELDEATYIRIEESEYVGDFHITFERDIDLNEHIDTDWMRDQCGDYSEERVIDALGNLCADKEFECRIHGVDDQEEKKND